MKQTDHLDAEGVAALADGTLTRAERAAMEAHAADCEQCLQLLAAVVRTEPPPVRSRWTWPAVARWGVPLLAGATAVAVWVNVQREPRDGTPPRAQAKADVQLRAEPTDARSALAEAHGSAPPPVSRSDAPAALSERDEAKARQEARSVARLEAPREKAAPPPAPATPDTAATTVPSPPAAASERAAAAPAPALGDRAQAYETALRRNAPVLVVSPAPQVRWRASAGIIERSGDAGETWTQQLTVPDTFIRAGVSPHPNVVWLVGTGGFIARSINGTDFDRRSFPEPVDLVSVRARSGLEADVTTADGRVFRTTDGGLTWSLQETPNAAF